MLAKQNSNQYVNYSFYINTKQFVFVLFLVFTTALPLVTIDVQCNFTISYTYRSSKLIKK